MPTQRRGKPTAGEARISAKNHPCCVPLDNALVCPFGDPFDALKGCGNKMIRITEIEAHIIGNHELTEAEAREWLTTAGFNDWLKHGQRREVPAPTTALPAE